jgi:uncharacterized protein
MSVPHQPDRTTPPAGQPHNRDDAARRNTSISPPERPHEPLFRRTPDGARIATARYLGGALPVPEPPPGSLHHQFLRAARQHQLMVQRCQRCESSQFPPEVICRACQSMGLEWVEIEPTGTVYTWARVFHSSNPAVRVQLPYLGVVVDVGLSAVRYVGNLLGDPNREVEIGAPVVAVFEHLDEETALVQWTLADGEI